MANRKLIIGIAVGSALALGAGLAWWLSTRKPSGEEAQNKAEADATALNTTTNTNPNPLPSVLPTAPFKNKVEGDAFRVWMNKAHPDFRYNGDILDLSGAFDNSFMKKAYQSYGAEYEKSKVVKTTPASTGVLKSGDMVNLNTSKATLYSYPEYQTSYILGDVKKTTSNTIGTFVQDMGNGWAKINPIGYFKYNSATSQYDILVKAIAPAYIQKVFLTK